MCAGVCALIHWYSNIMRSIQSSRQVLIFLKNWEAIDYFAVDQPHEIHLSVIVRVVEFNNIGSYQVAKV